eukprot:5407771-Pleurochrysis_carterae.AAC.1
MSLPAVKANSSTRTPPPRSSLAASVARNLPQLELSTGEWGALQGGAYLSSTHAVSGNCGLACHSLRSLRLYLELACNDICDLTMVEVCTVHQTSAAER